MDLNARCEMLRALVHKTAWLMDRDGAFSVSDKVSMCNYQANRLCCEAADFAMQVHGGMGYSRYNPSNISIGITAATASPKALTKSRCAGPPATCLVL